MRPCAELSAAGWLLDGDQPWERLIGFGPAGFPAYARLRFLPDPAYPGQSENDAGPRAGAPTETEQLRLALRTLARHTSTPGECYFCLWDGWGSYVDDTDSTHLVTHDGWRSYTDVADGGHLATGERSDPDADDDTRTTARDGWHSYADDGGHLATGDGRRSDPDADHDTQATARGGWRPYAHGGARTVSGSDPDGRGPGAAVPVPGIAPTLRRSRWDGPKLVLPHRAYYLFQGTVADLGDWGPAEMWPGRPGTHVPDPAFVWPADRAWCLANDVDPHWAGIGAGRPAIDQLLADRRLDVVPADPGEVPPRYL